VCFSVLRAHKTEKHRHPNPSLCEQGEQDGAIRGDIYYDNFQEASKGQ
jgi:hypothetical protein